MTVLGLSVVIPTAGRPALLRRCLGSISCCDPGAEEVLVVDQSGSSELAEVVDDFPGARLIVSRGNGVGRARNVGLAHASHDMVLVTDDDCTVANDWVAAACDVVGRDPSTLATGRVLPVGDPCSVPST